MPNISATLKMAQFAYKIHIRITLKYNVHVHREPYNTNMQVIIHLDKQLQLKTFPFGNKMKRKKLLIAINFVIRDVQHHSRDVIMCLHAFTAFFMVVTCDSEE